MSWKHCSRGNSACACPARPIGPLGSACLGVATACCLHCSLVEHQVLPVAGLKAATEGRFGEAETLFKVYLNGDPDSASAWSNLGNVHLSTGRAALALEDFDHAISLAPEVSWQDPAHSMTSLKRHAAVSAIARGQIVSS